MPEKNQLFEAVIEDITSEGSGVCHIDGMAVFVPDTAVGDKVKVRLVKVLKNYSYGIVEQMLSPSADRTENDCPVYKKCGGCVFRHISYEAECKIKAGIVENAFKRLGGIDTSYDPFISAENTTEYRNKAQYPVASLDGKAVCGFFAPRSHRIVPVTDCALQPEIFSEILETITDFLNDKRIRPYDEVSHTGIVRHIYLRQGAHSGEIMVCIVVRKELSRQLSPLTYILTRKFTDIKSIVMNINPDKTNVILGKNCITLWGKDTITDVMCGNTVEISPLSFYQVNTVQAERLYAKALEYAAPDKNDIIADLYCGAGTIGLSMAHKVKKIIGVEIVPEAVENARKNAERNSISNAEFYAGDAGIIFAQLRQKGCSPDIIVVDPPRKGCSDETLSQIIQAAPQKIVMISCNPSTAARDAKMLSQNGFSVDKVCGADLFPRTRHVECVVLMSRKK
ncbi:MAG TPA: 23S rRNA (uracil(1939)-C(5))-methyltransferase RlmD [Ruminococcus sp.]|nr:23S rRNA (uracil(1939)-C(5))-methyltransferase RlmD [Ruminococcus sp.]